MAIVSAAAHHGIELAAGIGLPGEPFLGRRRAALGWSALFSAHVAVSSVGGSRCDRLLAIAISTTIASATDDPAAGYRWHLTGLATLPAQHASARHHIAWLRNRGR